jgi:hypothetical protein
MRLTEAIRLFWLKIVRKITRQNKTANEIVFMTGVYVECNIIIWIFYWRDILHVFNYEIWYFVFWLPCILEDREHIPEIESVSVLRWRGEKTPTQSGPLENANLRHWTCDLAWTWGRKQIQFQKRRVFYSLELMAMENVQKSSNFVG